MLRDSTLLRTCVTLSCLLAAAAASKPYSYVVRYSRNFNDKRSERTPLVPRHASQAEHTPYHAPRYAPRHAPRLIVEEVRKTVEISIQEGYERGGYDHRHYQTQNTTWSEYENEGGYSDEEEEEGSKIRSSDYSSEENDEEVSETRFTTNTALYDSNVAPDSNISAENSYISAGNSNISKGISKLPARNSNAIARNSNLSVRNSNIPSLKASSSDSNIVGPNLNIKTPNTGRQSIDQPLNSYSHEIYTTTPPSDSLYLTTETQGKHTASLRNTERKQALASSLNRGSYSKEDFGQPAHFILPKLVQNNPFFFPITPGTAKISSFPSISSTNTTSTPATRNSLPFPVTTTSTPPPQGSQFSLITTSLPQHSLFFLASTTSPPLPTTPTAPKPPQSLL
ncbi:uncharacterized protein LOC135113434 [Scylla paramamosain]|uniref:uncharacterized protein LOC135113434 n=1 Tax=Scylla paramamosain TaxID=85552 RepID=UPI0030837305